MFTKAIVRQPSKSIVNGLTSTNLGIPNYEKALQQHNDYINALIKCGLQVVKLLPLEEYPDSTFVEDTALLTKECAIITNPGAVTRKGEIHFIEATLKNYYSNIEHILDPGTVEAGDIMMVNDHFYIGLSSRTNEEGAIQIIEILNKYELSGSVVLLDEVLHLKTGISYLDNNTCLAAGEFIKKEEFQNFKIIEVDEQENYAANSLWINDFVIVPKGYPNSKAKIEERGYKIIEVNVSEFQKIDGGLSCLSLRF